MTLYDAYGVPIRKPDTTPPAASKAKNRIKQLGNQGLKWFRHLRPVWKVLLGFVAVAATAATIFWGVEQLRQDISVDPYISYDSSDAFNQRFSITNNGPFSIYDVRYACAVTYLEAVPNFFDSRAMIVMVPVANPVPVLHWKEKTSTDCDFISRLGPSLTTVHIEIEVLYRRWLDPWTVHGPGWKFSAKRDNAGKFVWDYGSKDSGIFEGAGRVLILQPFNSDCASFDPNLAFNNYKEFALMLKKFGHKIIASDLTDCGKPK